MTEPKKAMRISPAPMADKELISVNDTQDLYSFNVAWYPAPVHKPMMYTPKLDKTAHVTIGFIFAFTLSTLPINNEETVAPTKPTVTKKGWYASVAGNQLADK